MGSFPLGKYHRVKNVPIRNFSGPNAGKYGPEKLQIRTPLTHCVSY